MTGFIEQHTLPLALVAAAIAHVAAFAFMLR
jgi:hypothetical protein